MLKKKVIASSISNLTDARYFAGWMVDYIVFHCDPSHPSYISPQEIGTFQSWVEGPQYFFELSREQYDVVEKILVDLGGHGVALPYDSRSMIANYDIPAIFYMTPSEFVLKSQEGVLRAENGIIVLEKVKDIYQVIKDVQSIRQSDLYKGEIFVELPQNRAEEEWVLSSEIDGFLMHGSPEEKVGFKSFDELDDIFEILQDF